ncbi:MAG: hypothetical protein H8E98_02880 [Bacteroidetes bacterium]|nr:hypothetical protein [Bacteroidota bacterium]
MSFKLDQFFSGNYEILINENMFYYSYKFPTKEVCDYLETLIYIPYTEFIRYVQNHIHILPITSKDIPQFSSLNVCTTKICKKFTEINDPGLSFVEVGKLLLDDLKVRNDVAYRKYGENHSKTAYELGLTQFKENTCYLSCIGYVFLSFDEKSQNAILARCILRNRFISRIIADSENDDINIMKYMHCLSKSTIIRRKPNIMSLINLCKEQYLHNQLGQLNKIYFEYK